MESNSFVLSPVSSTNEDSSWMHQKEFSDELRDTHTTTNNITSPLSSSSSLENSDLSDLLHLQSSSLPGSDSSSSENTHIKEESRHKQWKRKRQEEKTKCEKNRRNRFNEQLEMLRILVQQEIKANSKLPKFTRETVMSTAIDEIQKLRQGMSEMNRMLASTQRALQSQPTQNALDDPYNRISFSIEDLQRAFRVMLSKQMVQQHHMHKESTALDAICGLKMLYDVSKQTGKRENQLQVAALEQTFLTNIKFNMKNIVQVHESFWQPIQEYLKTRTDRVFLYDTDIGASLLKGLLLVQYAQGDFIALERTHKHLLEYFKKCSARSFKLCLHVVRTNPAALSLPVALKLNSLLEPTLFEHVGKITLGAVMVNYGQAQTGINLVERGVVSMMSEGKQNTCHLILAPVALEAYLRAGYVDRGLRFAKHTEKVFEETHMETYLGKAEILRLKANLLMLKKYPDFIPEPAVGREDADRYTTELMDVYASLPAKEEDLKPLAGPFPVLSMLEPNAEEIQEDVNVEEMFWNALEMAHNEELVIVELRCSVDLIRYYMHIGNMELAWKTVSIVKEVISRMKGKPNTEEIIRANFVISLADPSILMKQVEQE